MSIRLEVTGHAAAPIERVWDVLVDWEGQRRWIPFTTVEVHRGAAGTGRRGLGARLTALSGFRFAGLPIGLLDEFVVTGWSPPAGGRAELEVLHLGPYFTGPGVFSLAVSDQEVSDQEVSDRGTTIHCVELFDLPGAPLTEAVARLTLPIMRVGFAQSLAKLAAVGEQG